MGCGFLSRFSLVAVRWVSSAFIELRSTWTDVVVVVVVVVCIRLVCDSISSTNFDLLCVPRRESEFVLSGCASLSRECANPTGYGCLSED